ncbi:S41 family peptidase [Mucilaginibacter sp. UR6-11]|uniref:S41 family peptidase n=1 Tax=Mucilaginibacter sp. UR6-11 TaxID=1435644 RepID=UPI001E3A7F80|nr:S41 family peptidase [Mucilaginibacter sp. UR6-11]MCC8424793.1 S41 family peptidase [Mucilaginibacter sp. UR6-11]
MKCLYLSILALSLCVFCRGQDTVKSNFGKYYSVNQLKTDFVFFRTTLEKAHPSLYRYEFKDTIDYYFNQAQVKLDHPMNELDFWKVLQTMVVKIESGHTHVSFADETIRQLNLTPALLLPFTIYTEDNRLFIKRRARADDSLLKAGSEILVINNERGTSILQQMHSLESGDGYSNSFKDFRIEKEFNWLYNLLHGNQGQFLITVKYKGVIKTRLFKAAKVMPRTINPERLPSVSYPADMPNTAFLRVPDFVYKKEYESLHRQLFKDIKQHKAENLVIDLRDNPGGKTSVAADLMGYFMTNDFKFTLADEMYVNPTFFKHLADNTAKDMTILHDIENINRQLYREVYNDDVIQQTRMGSFKGNVYLLINGGTFSAAALFAAAVKQQRNCTIIGEETGGGAAGCDGGILVDVTLPNTRLKLHLPLFWTYAVNAKNDRGRGLLPDIRMTPEKNEKYFGAGLDPVIETLKEVINTAANKTP